MKGKNMLWEIECDKPLGYIDDVIDYLNSQLPMIMNFFKLKTLTKKVKIVIWTDINKYRAHCEQYTSYKEWMCGDTFGGNINMLSIEECRKTKAHKNMDIKEFKTTIAHEFVHICHGESILEDVPEKFSWFWEALATNLANPFDKLIEVNVSKDELMNQFNNIKNGYQMAYTIGKYMLTNYSEELIQEYIKYPRLLIRDTDKILVETNEWIQQENYVTHKLNK